MSHEAPVSQWSIAAANAAVVESLNHRTLKALLVWKASYVASHRYEMAALAAMEHCRRRPLLNALLRWVKLCQADARLAAGVAHHYWYTRRKGVRAWKRYGGMCDARRFLDGPARRMRLQVITSLYTPMAFPPMN